MKKNFTPSRTPLLYTLVLLVFISACKKDKKVVTPVVPQATPFTMGLYEYSTTISNINYKRVFMPVYKVGNAQVDTSLFVFDTGSSGMTLDAHGLIPDNLITSTGITFTGDSLVVNGITITSKRSTMSYGDNISSTKEYGYLAYADVTIGDPRAETASLKRVPFFLYYKIVDGDGTIEDPHSSDIFGVGPGTSYATSEIASPFIKFDTGSNLTSGFKLATLVSTSFLKTVPYVTNLLTVGLQPADLSSAGFVMHPLAYSSVGGYSANISSTLSYGGKTISTPVLFDTGTPALTVIEDKTAANAIGQLPANTEVTLTTDQGFIYKYETANKADLTEVQNPNNTGDNRTVFAIDFFIKNEFLTDYKNHKIGLKNN